jgi:hypothetical protein
MLQDFRQNSRLKIKTVQFIRPKKNEDILEELEVHPAENK